MKAGEGVGGISLMAQVREGLRHVNFEIHVGISILAMVITAAAIVAQISQIFDIRLSECQARFSMAGKTAQWPSQ